MLLEIFLEVFLLSIIVLGSYLGIKKGFFKLAERPLKIIVSLIVAFSLADSLAENIIAPTIEAPLANYVKEYVYMSSPELSPEQLATNMPAILRISAGLFGISLEYDSHLTADEVLGDIALRLTSPVISVVSVIISFLLLVLLVRLLISLIIKITGSIFDRGVLLLVNRGLGFLLAGVLSLAIAWGFASLVDFLFHAPPLASAQALDGFVGGPLYSFFTKISPIAIILSF